MPRQKFGIITTLSLKKTLLCKVAKVSRSGYYRWLKQADKPEKDHEDYVIIKEIFDIGKGKYGWRTIHMKLKREKGIIMNSKKITRIKNKYGLITKIRKRNPYKAIMKKTQEHRTFDNTLNRQFKQVEPKKVFCTDITYMPFNHRMAYLSVVKDIASKEVVAWNISRNLQVEIVTDTITSMEKTLPKETLKDAMIHSDQGFHYTNPAYIQRIKNLNMVQSMSRKGTCIDNAPIESFFGHFKDEVNFKQCKTFQELKHLTQIYMNYYNNQRPQWNLKKMTPVEYRNHFFSNT